VSVRSGPTRVARRKTRPQIPHVPDLFEQTKIETDARNPASADLLTDLPRDRWLLTSLLQKSIRRGSSHHAAASASILADIAPEYIAARLPVIAYEDIGVAAPELILAIKQAAASIPVLAPSHQRSVASSIAARLSESIKSRASCDIVSLLDSSAETRDVARVLRQCRVEDCIKTATDRAQPLVCRTVALRFAIGLRVQGVRSAAEGHITRLPSLALGMNLPASLVAAIHAGRQTHDLNWALPLAYDLIHSGPEPLVKKAPAKAMRTVTSSGVALCAADMFTRCGRQAYRSLSRANAELSRLLKTGAPGADPASVVGITMFHIEGSTLDRALVSPATVELLQMVEAQEARQAGLRSEQDAKALRCWLLANLDTVNEFRADALSTYLKSNDGATV
jgi:hypothetical protein